MLSSLPVAFEIVLFYF
uniref:Uncharacterized protein n=1 Tax=Anguilla anguilla TaxID=7936 RepID=A0A0E9UWQ3_ANGAN